MTLHRSQIVYELVSVYAYFVVARIDDASERTCSDNAATPPSTGGITSCQRPSSNGDSDATIGQHEGKCAYLFFRTFDFHLLPCGFAVAAANINSCANDASTQPSEGAQVRQIAMTFV